jgi:hypothetical protein
MTGFARSRHAFPGANPSVNPGVNPTPRDSQWNDGLILCRAGAARVGNGVLGEGGATPSGSRSPLAIVNRHHHEPRHCPRRRRGSANVTRRTAAVARG